MRVGSFTHLNHPAGRPMHPDFPAFLRTGTTVVGCVGHTDPRVVSGFGEFHTPDEGTVRVAVKGPRAMFRQRGSRRRLGIARGPVPATRPLRGGHSRAPGTPQSPLLKAG